MAANASLLADTQTRPERAACQKVSCEVTYGSYKVEERVRSPSSDDISPVALRQSSSVLCASFLYTRYYFSFLFALL